MKALTLWQPWASLCVEIRPGVIKLTATGRRCDDGLYEYTESPVVWKRIETRSWPAPRSVIGQRIAIHAAVRPLRADELSDISRRANVSISPERWPLGAFVGTVDLVDCVPMYGVGAVVEAFQQQRQNELAWPHLVVRGESLTLVSSTGVDANVSDQEPFGLFDHGRWAWLIENPVKLDEPIPCKGAQGLWDVPAGIEERLR